MSIRYLWRVALILATCLLCACSSNGSSGSTDSALVSYVSRYTAVSGTIDADSEQSVLTVDQPFSNHNGGQIAFGPDGYLYVGFGDGGSGGDPRGHGQNTHTLLGAMLRIDVDGGVPYAVPMDNPFAASSGCGDGGGCPELFAWGLRNPWRWSFDRVTGDLWLGDVGQGAWEEVDLIRHGENYGWAIREGANCYPPGSNCAKDALVDPRAQYGRSQGFSITGGYVYRGSAVAALQGHYLYGDYGSGRIWALNTDTNNAEPVLLMNTDLSISSFAEDHAGEIYVLDYGSGEIHKLVPSGDVSAVQLQRVFPNLSFTQPVAMLQAPGDTTRFYVVEKNGRVRAFDNDPVADTVDSFFTDSNDLVDAGPNEAGLLGMAFHPDYANNATVYLSYTRDPKP